MELFLGSSWGKYKSPFTPQLVKCNNMIILSNNLFIYSALKLFMNISKVYSNWLIILILFLSSYAHTEETTKKIPKAVTLPSFLQEVTKPIGLSATSVFYNQLDEKKSLENFDNRFIIVHFWASWCMECQNELLVLNKLQKEFRKKALLIFAISEDFKGIGAVDEYFTKHQIDYLDIYIDKKSKIYQSLNVNHLPVSYLIDFDGKVIAQSNPGTIIDWNDEELKEFLEAKVSKYQLLPPEFKKPRDKYESPKKPELPNKITKQDKKNKSNLFIN